MHLKKHFLLLGFLLAWAVGLASTEKTTTDKIYKNSSKEIRVGVDSAIKQAKNSYTAVLGKLISKLGMPPKGYHFNTSTNGNRCLQRYPKGNQHYVENAPLLTVKNGVVRLANAVGKVRDNIINSVAGDIRKFSEYALVNPSKTDLFVDSWGYKLADADNLLSIYKSQAVQAIKNGKVISNGVDKFGNQVYKIETILNTPLKGEVKVYAGWIIKPNKIDEIILSTPFGGFVK